MVGYALPVNGSASDPLSLPLVGYADLLASRGLSLPIPEPVVIKAHSLQGPIMGPAGRPLGTGLKGGPLSLCGCGRIILPDYSLEFRFGHRFLTKSQKSPSVDLRGQLGRRTDFSRRKYTCADLRHPPGQVPGSETRGPRGPLRHGSWELGKSSDLAPEITAIGYESGPLGRILPLLRMGGTDQTRGSPQGVIPGGPQDPRVRDSGSWRTPQTSASGTLLLLHHASSGHHYG